MRSAPRSGTIACAWSGDSHLCDSAASNTVRSSHDRAEFTNVEPMSSTTTSAPGQPTRWRRENQMPAAMM